MRLSASSRRAAGFKVGRPGRGTAQICRSALISLIWISRPRTVTPYRRRVEKARDRASGARPSLPARRLFWKGRRIEAELPSGRLQMNNLGLVTYSGMPDPNYAGPFANLVNPPEQERGGMQPIVEPMMEEEVVNPCPPGYALVDGVCQPLAGTAQPAAATPAVVPSSFQPTYQPFQPQPLNPFVLSPQSGISGISPTGAALGRSV